MFNGDFLVCSNKSDTGFRIRSHDGGTKATNTNRSSNQYSGIHICR